MAVKISSELASAQLDAFTLILLRRYDCAVAEENETGYADCSRTSRAYLFGHITHTGPKLLRILLLLFRRRLDIKSGLDKVSPLSKLC